MTAILRNSNAFADWARNAQDDDGTFAIFPIDWWTERNVDPHMLNEHGELEADASAYLAKTFGTGSFAAHLRRSPVAVAAALTEAA